MGNQEICPQYLLGRLSTFCELFLCTTVFMYSHISNFPMGIIHCNIGNMVAGNGDVIKKCMKNSRTGLRSCCLGLHPASDRVSPGFLQSSAPQMLRHPFILCKVCIYPPFPFKPSAGSPSDLSQRLSTVDCKQDGRCILEHS